MRGGGVSVANLWVDGEITSGSGVTVIKQDDNGYRIIGTPTRQWLTFMSASKSLDTLGLTTSDSLAFKVFGDYFESDSKTLSVIVWFESETSKIGSLASGKSIKIPNGTTKIRCAISTTNMRDTIDATVYPMLVTGTNMPTEFIPYA